MKNLLLTLLFSSLVLAEGPKCEKALKNCYASLRVIEKAIEAKDFKLYAKEIDNAKLRSCQVATFCRENEKLGKNIYKMLARR